MAKSLKGVVLLPDILQLIALSACSKIGGVAQCSVICQMMCLE